jgi:hypothetical protein
MIAWVCVVFSGWVVSLVGLASRFWKVQVSNPISNHFGVDQIILQGSRYTVATHYTSAGGVKCALIAHASGVALSFGIFGVVHDHQRYGMVARRDDRIRVEDRAHAEGRAKHTRRGDRTQTSNASSMHITRQATMGMHAIMRETLSAELRGVEGRCVSY